MMISVVIATRDRAALLERTLDALCGQLSPGCPFEILVVDNGSVDATSAVVAAAAHRSHVPVVYLREEKPGKSHALNTAVAHARGDLLAFLSGLRKRDGDGLFSTFHLASLAALATLCFPTLVAVHLAFDFRACSSRILTLSLFRHLALLGRVAFEFAISALIRSNSLLGA